MIKCVTSSLRSLELETSHWMMDAPRSGRLYKMDNDEIETLTENNQHYTTWEIADILKIYKSITLLVKMKNSSFILWENDMNFLTNPM